MRAAFERIAILGLGLLGGSVALAARERRVATRVVGAARRPDVLEQALRRGAVDETASFQEAVRGADLVVLATPVFAMGDLVRGVGGELRPGTLVTDVGSVKVALVETLPGLLPPGVSYVGAHPMAGSHERGLEHARADLFEGAPCIVTESRDSAARDRVCAFWRALGARVVLRDAAVHDAEVAWMSHVPHVLAFAFAGALAEAPSGAREVPGSGFRDFTRIAQSDPELWAEILTANRKAISAPLHAAAAALERLSRSIEANEAEALARWIATARQTLSRVNSQRGTRREGGRVRRPHSDRENPQPPDTPHAGDRARRSNE